MAKYCHLLYATGKKPAGKYCFQRQQTGLRSKITSFSLQTDPVHQKGSRITSEEHIIKHLFYIEFNSNFISKTQLYIATGNFES